MPATSQSRCFDAVLSRTLKRLVVPSLFAALVFGAGLWTEHQQAQRRSEIHAAQSENRALRIRQAALRARWINATRRLEALSPEAVNPPGRERRGASPTRGREST